MRGIRRDTVNERVVRILLEWILVLENKFISARQNQTLISFILLLKETIATEVIR